MDNKEKIEWIIKTIENTAENIILLRELSPTALRKWQLEDLNHDIEVLNAIKKDYESKKQEPVLDDIERKYLKNILRPFKDEIKWVCKFKCFNPKDEYITIELETDSIRLPYFIADTMYKNMENGKKYTLEELGIHYKDNTPTKMPDGIITIKAEDKIKWNDDLNISKYIVSKNKGN